MACNAVCLLHLESLSSGVDLEHTVSFRRRDSGIGDEQSSMTPSESVAGSSQGPDAVSEALSTLSLEVRKGQEGAAEAKGKNVNVKDILRSLVSGPADDLMVDPSLLPPAFLGAVGGDGSRDQSLQFQSFDRSVSTKTNTQARGSQGALSPPALGLRNLASVLVA